LWHEYFSLGRAALKPEMVAALVCREMKWTWEEYQNEPSWFIEIILTMLQQEGEANNRRNAKT
jgi:hypothetical protein